MALKRRTLGQMPAFHKPEWKPKQMSIVQKNTKIELKDKSFRDYYAEVDLKENPYTKSGKKRTLSEARRTFDKQFERRKQFVQQAGLTSKYSDDIIGKEIVYNKFRGSEKKSQFERMYTQWTEARYKGTPEEVQAKKEKKVREEQWKGYLKAFGDVPIDGIAGHTTFREVIMDPSKTDKDIEDTYNSMIFTEAFKNAYDAYYGDGEWDAHFNRF